MVQFKNFKIPIPNSGILFLLAGLAVGNYSYEKYQQKYLSRGPPPQVRKGQTVLSTALDSNAGLKFRPSTASSSHPLDPLSTLEMQLIGHIVRSYNTSSLWEFKCIGFREPDKDLMLPYYESRRTPPPGLIPRRANVLITDPVDRTPYFVIVNLSEGEVESWTEAKPGNKVGTITYEDDDLAQAIAFNDTKVAERLKKEGYNDRSNIIGDVWDAGYVKDNPIYAQAKKLVQVFFYAIKGEGNDYYAHPFGFVVYVELGPNVVLGIEDLPIQEDFDTSNRRGESIPTADANYLEDLLPANSIQKNLNRLIISQPDGPSFKVKGHEVTWQNFNLRIGYNPREGFYLNTITYDDNGRIRPIMYRLSLSEVYLSYGDPRPPYHRKSSYEIGNGEFGSSITSLPVHQFCRGNAFYFQSDHHNQNAETWITQNSLCAVEEDVGILWAHYDDSSGKTEAVRNQRLALTSLVNYGDTDYLISWRFYQDATIELAIKVTGLFSTNLMAVDVKAPTYGNLLMPQVYTENYQHFFAVRMELDIDGVDNTVSVGDIVRVSDSIGPENPFGNGITKTMVDLTTPAEAATDTKPHRCWKISNRNKVASKLNGKPPAWSLLPDAPSPSMLTPDSPLIPSRLEWTKHNVWVLPYNIDELYAAGEYLDCGIAKWTRENADVNITNTDIVLWHVFNYVHIPGVEDWPVLSTRDEIGFKLRPSNFFKQNPALYSPRAKEMTQLDGIGVHADINIHIPEILEH